MYQVVKYVDASSPYRADISSYVLGYKTIGWSLSTRQWTARVLDSNGCQDTPANGPASSSEHPAVVEGGRQISVGQISVISWIW